MESYSESQSPDHSKLSKGISAYQITTLEGQLMTIVDVEIGQMIAQKPLPGFEIQTLAFTSDDRYLVAEGYPTSGSRILKSMGILIDLERFLRS